MSSESPLPPDALPAVATAASPAAPAAPALLAPSSRSRYRMHLARALWRAALVLPVLTTAIYVFALAAPRYVSDSRVVVKHSSESPALAGGLGVLLGGIAGSSMEDAYFLRDYLLSHDMLAHVEREIGFRIVFERISGDPLARLWPWFRQEERLAYFRERVTVALDAKTGSLAISTQGLDAAYAQRLNATLVAEAERYINAVSQRIAVEQLEFSNNQLARAQARLAAAREQVLVYQNEHGLIDPAAQIESAGRTVAEMQARRAAIEAELRNLQTYLLPDAPQVAAQRAALASLQQQIDAERRVLAAPRGERLNRVAARFAELRAALEFEADLYKLSLAALEKTRIDTARKVKYLAVISQPMLPERPEYPRRVASLLTALLATAMLAGGVRLAAGIVRDHRS